MEENRKMLCLERTGKGRVHAARPASRGTRILSKVFMMTLAGFVFGFSPHAQAERSGAPTANRIFFNCSFTTEGLNSALQISTKNRNAIGGQIQASYIIIYVRPNPNDGQNISGTTTYTGPVLCTNANEDIVQSTETTRIPGPVDILGAEESLHLQHRPSSSTDPNDTEKRVCHTVASNTDCFFIRTPQ